MKTLKSVLVLFTFLGLMFVGCSDESQSPISPSDQGLLAKDKKNVEFTFTSSPDVFIADPTEYMNFAGRTVHMKDYPVIDLPIASDNRVTGRMEHFLSFKLDLETGEGPCHGKWTIIPSDLTNTDEGIWEGTYEGFRFKTEDPYVFILPIKLIGRGSGGSIDKMQILMKADLVVSTNAAYFPMPIYWVTTNGTGVIKEH